MERHCSNMVSNLGTSLKNNSSLTKMANFIHQGKEVHQVDLIQQVVNHSTSFQNKKGTVPAQMVEWFHLGKLRGKQNQQDELRLQKISPNQCRVDQAKYWYLKKQIWRIYEKKWKKNITVQSSIRKRSMFIHVSTAQPGRLGLGLGHCRALGLRR